MAEEMLSIRAPFYKVSHFMYESMGSFYVIMFLFNLSVEHGHMGCDKGWGRRGVICWWEGGGVVNE